jgi:hypothetical protein
LPSRIASRYDALSDSSIERRIHSTTSAATPPMKKPTRHPHAVTVSTSRKLSRISRVN